MAINAISGNYLGGISYTRIDSEHEEIKRLLLALGLEVTGQKSVDKARLSQAQLEKEIEATQKATEDEKSKAKEKSIRRCSFLLQFRLIVDFGASKDNSF